MLSLFFSLRQLSGNYPEGFRVPKPYIAEEVTNDFDFTEVSLAIRVDNDLERPARDDARIPAPAKRLVSGYHIGRNRVG